MTSTEPLFVALLSHRRLSGWNKNSDPSCSRASKNTPPRTRPRTVAYDVWKEEQLRCTRLKTLLRPHGILYQLLHAVPCSRPTGESCYFAVSKRGASVKSLETRLLEGGGKSSKSISRPSGQKVLDQHVLVFSLFLKIVRILSRYKVRVRPR